MRKILSGIAVLALTTASATVAIAAPPAMAMSHAMGMPKCTSASGPVVWYMSATKKYFAKGAAMYGKGSGKYVCKGTAAKMKGAHMGAMGAMMSHPHRKSGVTTNGSTTMRPGAPAPPTPGAMAPGSMATPGAMAPGSMASPGAMTPGTMASPGSMSPGPATSPQMNKAGPVSPGTGGSPAPAPKPS